MDALLIVTLPITAAWVIWSLYSSMVETLQYTVVEKRSMYEIRQYEPYIAIQTEVEGSTREAMSRGFTILANYIFGGNTANKSVAMASPVMETTSPKPLIEVTNKSMRVAMTSPVLEQKNGNKRTITFTAPKEYTMDTLPKPNSDRVTFVTIPAKKYAVLRFTWYYTDAKIESKKKELQELLKRDNIQTLSEPMFAWYNGPGTIPFLMRNEVLIQVE
jgi:SOUL heme-binding protein